MDSPPASVETITKRKRTQKVLVDNPNMDLDTYIANYDGHTKVERLLFIADRCPSYQIEALRLAVASVKTEFDTSKYMIVAGKLNDALKSRNMPTESVDNAWVESTQRQVRMKTDKLEMELKNYKTNCIKESIRMGYTDLGDHYYRCGDLTNALKSYSRTRDYCSTPKHLIDYYMNVIKISIEMGNFSHVSSYVAKAEAITEMPEKSLTMAKLKCTSALAHLDEAKYKHAARLFLETSFELGSKYSDIISPNDIAVYGGLCALATFERSELRTKVIDNVAFKNFLELEPHIREIILNFYQSKYATCLELLDKHKADFLLDIYLHPHIDTLYQSIRKKAIIQYFSPFISVDLKKMATALNTSVTELEKEVSRLITDKVIMARIDSHNKVLHAKQSDERSAVFAKTISIAAEYEKNAKHALLRMNMLKNGFIVKPERSS